MMDNLKCRKKRSKNGKHYFYCSKLKNEIKICDCQSCPNKEYKNQSPLKKITSSKRTNAVSITTKTKLIVLIRDGGQCIFCGLEGMAEAHVIPRSNGGLGIPENIICTCRLCHEKLDQTKKRKEMLSTAIQYLKKFYPDWDPENLTYKKGKKSCENQQNQSVLKLA